MATDLGGDGRGVEPLQIIGGGEGPGAAVLPSSTRVVPTDAMTSMEALHELYAPAWDKAMQQFLRPRIDARELLIPGVFAGRIRQARKDLQDAARKGKSKPLRDAALLLEEDEEMKEALSAFNAKMGTFLEEKGDTDPGVEQKTAQEKYDAAVKANMEATGADKITAYANVANTEEGKKLIQAIYKEKE